MSAGFPARARTLVEPQGEWRISCAQRDCTRLPALREMVCPMLRVRVAARRSRYAAAACVAAAGARVAPCRRTVRSQARTASLQIGIRAQEQFDDRGLVLEDG